MRNFRAGIVGVEVYFPQTYACQEELEQFDGAPKGKYTIGLGQQKLSFINTFEDVNSMALTAVKNLLQKYQIDPKNIGRLEVGTETMVDKAQSSKTVLMQLFKESGNHDIEGVTTVNACYGGTAAFFNTIAWVESSVWDGRYGLVVMSDVAVYAKGPARPTGGAGAIALLISRDAILVIEPLRSTFIDHEYDFYKPNPRSEYPTVDGHLSINTYLNAVDQCFATIKQKQRNAKVQELSLENFDYACFHAPFAQMVQKAFTRLVYNDLLTNPKFPGDNAEAIQILKENKYDSKIVQDVLSQISAPLWQKKCQPSTFLGENLGNIYTGSLYSGLISLICDETINLESKRILMFSYGSGLASSLFLLRVDQNISEIRKNLNLKPRLSQRVKIPITQFDKIMELREKNFGVPPPFAPEIDFSKIFPGSYYLQDIDKMWRRTYQLLPNNQGKITSNQLSNSVSKNIPNLIMVSNDNGDVTRITSDVTGGVARLENLDQKINSVAANQNYQQIWTGFYKKTIPERLNLLQQLEPELQTDAFNDGGLQVNRANLMVENCIGQLSLPLGLGLNFVINNQNYQIPMCIEEPSVIAACSSAAQFIYDNSIDSPINRGFTSYSTDPIMMGQIQVVECSDYVELSFIIEKHKKQIISKANENCLEMVKRGGGVVDVRFRQLQQTDKKSLKSTGLYTVETMGSIDIYINVCESMGANLINTVCEKVSPFIQSLAPQGSLRLGVKILSNLCTERRAVSIFQLPLKNMAWKSVSGHEVAEKIIETYRFAQLDRYRATTHNQGILNGIDAVALALGQDWRAIQAACHAFASEKSNSYQPLSHYEIVKENGELYLKGSLEIPIAVGIKGGVLSNNEIYESNMKLLGYPKAQALSEIMATVGLAQNFAAVRALAIEGIQKGHMSLHARNFAISAGVPSRHVEDAVFFMKQRGQVSHAGAKEFLQAFEIYREISQKQEHRNTPKSIHNNLSTSTSSSVSTSQAIKLSSFFVDLRLKGNVEIFLHIVFDCGTPQSLNIKIDKLNDENKPANQMTIQEQLHEQLFGPKHHSWLQMMFENLELVRMDVVEGDGDNSSQNLKEDGSEKFFVMPDRNLIYKLQMIVILLDLLTFNLMSNHHMRQVGDKILQIMQTEINNDQFADLKDQNESGQPDDLQYGLMLMIELSRVFKYTLDSLLVKDPSYFLAKLLKNELVSVIESQVMTFSIWNDQQKGLVNEIESQPFLFDKFFNARKKRLCATMILLCDAINFPPSKLTKERIKVIMAMGRIYQWEITFIRDLQKWKANLNQINSYSFWLIVNNLFLQGEDQQIKQRFIEQLNFVIGKDKESLMPQLSVSQQKIFEKTTKVIYSFYKFGEQGQAKPKL